MRRQIERLNWRPERWAHEANLSPTTVTRAMSESYQSVSSVTTLHALARAANVPSILDFLDGQANFAPRFPMITEMLKELLPMIGCDVPEHKVVLLAEALSQAIAGMAEQPPESSSDPELARALARAARGVFNR